MRVSRWAAFWLFAILVTIAGTEVVAAQYDDGLPVGLEQITVDGQPIDASTIPQVGTTNPVFAGRLTTDATEVEIGLGNGEIVRFPLAIDPDTGRFRGTAPTPLTATTYAVYVDDALVGEFVVSPEAVDPAAVSGGLDLARLVPFPFDLTEAYPGLGALRQPPPPIRFFSLGEEARLDSGAASAATREQALLDAGFLQRYTSSLAVPDADDPTRFRIQVVSSVVEYATAEAAQAQFAAAADQDGDPIAGAATVGDESRFSRGEGVAGETEAPFRSLTLGFRQDRIVVRVVIADLGGGEPDQATAETIAAVLQARAAAVIAGDAVALAPTALRPDLGRVQNPGDLLQTYEVLDGQVVDVYGQSDDERAQRAGVYGGTSDVYASSFIARRGNGAGRDDATPQPGGVAATPGAGGAGDGGSISYGVTTFVFPDDDAATAWLGGVGARLDQDVGYLVLAPVNDGTVFGNGTATYRFQRQIGEETVGGHGVYVRVGARVFVLEAAGRPEVSLAEVESLVADQVVCLEAGVCPGAAASGAGRAATPAATPATGTATADREERLRQREEAAADGTPASGGDGLTQEERRQRREEAGVGEAPATGENPDREERERRRQEREQQRQQEGGA